MYIVENECLEEIRKIWIENNSGYIGNNCNLRSINDNNMLKVVYVKRIMMYVAMQYYILKKIFVNLKNILII